MTVPSCLTLGQARNRATGLRVGFPIRYRAPLVSFGELTEPAFLHSLPALGCRIDGPRPMTARRDAGGPWSAAAAPIGLREPMTRTPSPDHQVSWGNALDEGSQDGRRGWFIGHFIDPTAGPAATDAVEVKWGLHEAGETKATEGVNQTATTLSILVSGRFQLDFPSHGCGVTLDRPGDYAIWSPGVSHRWLVIEDAVVVTVRWPSSPNDQAERARGPRAGERG